MTSYYWQNTIEKIEWENLIFMTWALTWREETNAKWCKLRRLPSTGWCNKEVAYWLRGYDGVVVELKVRGSNQNRVLNFVVECYSSFRHENTPYVTKSWRFCDYNNIQASTCTLFLFFFKFNAGTHFKITHTPPHTPYTYNIYIQYFTFLLYCKSTFWPVFHTKSNIQNAYEGRILFYSKN